MGQHSFQEVMKQWKRMCDTCSKVKQEHGACGCFPAGNYAVCNMKEMSKEAELAFDDRYFERMEMVIMSWAAEHPEPVYPTWYEWLTSIGAVTRKVKPDVASTLIETGLLDPIPADLAQKLGIEPKEGV